MDDDCGSGVMNVVAVMTVAEMIVAVMTVAEMIVAVMSAALMIISRRMCPAVRLPTTEEKVDLELDDLSDMLIRVAISDMIIRAASSDTPIRVATSAMLIRVATIRMLDWQSVVCLLK